MSRWAIKVRVSEAGKANIEDEPRGGRPVSVTDAYHQMAVSYTHLDVYKRQNGGYPFNKCKLQVVPVSIQ